MNISRCHSGENKIYNEGRREKAENVTKKEKRGNRSVKDKINAKWAKKAKKVCKE
jgi:hypothetical protein